MHINEHLFFNFSSKMARYKFVGNKFGTRSAPKGGKPGMVFIKWAFLFQGGRLRVIIALFPMLIFAGCTQHAGVTSVDQLQNLNSSSISSSGVNSIRIQALQETAMTVGAQAGL